MIRHANVRLDCSKIGEKCMIGFSHVMPFGLSSLKLDVCPYNKEGYACHLIDD